MILCYQVSRLLKVYIPQISIAVAFTLNGSVDTRNLTPDELTIDHTLRIEVLEDKKQNPDSRDDVDPLSA